MDPVNMPEILIVNCIGIILMVFLRLTRIENIEKRFAGDILFDIMIRITIAGCAIEILTFLIDGRIFPFCREISYLLNSFCFIGTCGVGFLWCLYVDLRVYNNVGRIRRRAKLLVIPFVLDVLLNLVNVSGCGIVFTVSDDNVYHRGSLVLTVYVILFFYFIYSICLVDHSKKSGLHIRFLPGYYFVVPCMLGTIVQGVLYGVTIGWTSLSEPYTLPFAMGYSRLEASSEDVERFLSLMDERMYAAKRQHYQQASADRRKDRTQNGGA